MPNVSPELIDIVLLEDTVWIATCPIDAPRYDFSFHTYFACRHRSYRSERITAVGRFGVTDDYAELGRQLAEIGVDLVHSTEQHALASELTEWYPLLADLTPRSVWFEEPPSVAEIEEHFTWPIFLKGSRQTSRHQAALSILRSPDEYLAAMEVYRRNPVLYRQAVVCRELVPLRPVAAPPSALIPPSFEFRTFWWRGECVGAGPYWAAVASYGWTEQEERAALEVAGEAARRLDVPFLVVDVAQTGDGEWIVIEVNDGQESSYGGIAPMPLWQKVIDAERRRVG